MVTKTSLRATMVQMDLGEKLEVSAADYTWNTVRNYATMLGIRLDRAFTVHYDRARKTIEATRIR